MRAIHKKTVATTLMALLCGSASAANNDVTYIFKMNVDGKTKVPEWITINYIYDAWINQGARHGHLRPKPLIGEKHFNSQECAAKIKPEQTHLSS